MGQEFPQTFGQYTLVERLAVGGMAELFLATVSGAHGFARTLVIKRLLPHLAKDANFNAMFIDEAKLTARLVHPKIAQTYELGRNNGQLYIAMEYVDGLDVLSLLRECAHRRARAPQEIAVYVAHEVLDALDFAHNQTSPEGKPLGIVHRDISPSNILLSRRGDVKLVDFGIARAFAQDHATKAGTLKGKYGYMAPEQVIEGAMDGRSDLFSVGIVLAEMLTGRRLFAATNELDVLLMVRDARLARLDRFGTDIDPDLDALLRRGLRKNPDERFGSAAEFRDALGEWLFAKRLRVTPRHLAEVVESLYEPARERKREGMQAAEQARVAVVGAVVDAGARPASAGGAAGLIGGGGAASVVGEALTLSGLPDIPLDPGPLVLSEIDGIPSGDLRLNDSMPVISIEEDEASRPTGAQPRAATSPGEIARRATSLRKSAPRLHSTAAGTPATPSAEPDNPRGTMVADQPAADPAAPPAASASGSREPSTRYPSIEAAINALARPELDPAASDFDENAAGSGGVQPRGTPRLPSPEELARSTPPPPPVVGEITAPADDTGDFSVSPPVGVLFRLTSTRATGLLFTSIGGLKKEIYFRDGVPEYVSSNMASELFGSYLVTQNVLSEGELAMALAMMPHYGGKLGDTLVGLGLLKPLEVFRHLTRQVRQKLIDVCTWSKGNFSWYAGRENPREAFPLDINPLEVLGAGAMALPASVIAVWFERSATQRPRAAKSARNRPDHFEVKGLRDLYDTIDGRRTLREIADRCTNETERHRTLCMLFLLQHVGLVRPT